MTSSWYGDLRWVKLKTKTVLPHTLAVHMIDALYFENLLAEVEVKFTAWVVRIRFGTEARGWGGVTTDVQGTRVRMPLWKCIGNDGGDYVDNESYVLFWAITVYSATNECPHDSTVWRVFPTSHISTTVNTLRPMKNGRHFRTTLSDAFSWMKMYKLRLRFHWSLLLRFELAKFQHCYR